VLRLVSVCQAQRLVTCFHGSVHTWCPSTILAGHLCEHTFLPSTRITIRAQFPCPRFRPCTQALNGTCILGILSFSTQHYFVLCARAPVLWHKVQTQPMNCFTAGLIIEIEDGFKYLSLLLSFLPWSALVPSYPLATSRV